MTNSQQFPELQPQQQVLLDSAVLVRYAHDVPNEPDKAVVESWQTGPIVVERTRLQLIA